MLTFLHALGKEGEIGIRGWMCATARGICDGKLSVVHGMGRERALSTRLG